MPERPRTPQPAGGRRARVPLALKVVMTGASMCSAKAQDLVPVRAGAVAADDHRPLGGREQLDRPGQLGFRRGDAGGGHPPGRGRARRLGEAGQLLHLVGEDEVGDVALHDGVLHGQGGQLGGVSGAAPSGSTRPPAENASASGDLLEGARARAPGSAPGRSGRRSAPGRPWRPTGRSAGWWRRGRRWRSRPPGRPVSLA